MDTIGIYIHIPFCDQKCPYCDFFSISDIKEYDRYTEAVLSTTEILSKKHKRIVSSIYFGGGTPSVIGTDRLVKILDEVYNRFDVLSDAEVTLEVNPCSSYLLDFERLYSAGFNRVSIGLQSANEDELNLLGRRHKASDAKLTVNKAKEGGFKNISLDLMLCVPNQTKSSLSESIKFCKDCGVQHISAYILKFEKNTQFYRMKDRFTAFSDDEQAQMYIHVVNELEKYGYHQYEISNFAKVGFEGKHNLKYWRDEEYLGIGPSAHSFIDGKRYFYSRDFNDFYNHKIVDDGVGGDIEEYIMLNLRLKEGLNLLKLKDRYNFTPNKYFLYRVNKLKSEGLLDFDGETISLNASGFLVSNTIINYIIDVL